MKEEIENILKSAFQPVFLAVTDDSQEHAGHPEAVKSGGGHFCVLVVSAKFAGKSPLERHRLVYQCLQDRIKKGIHALAIRALTPQENAQQ